MNLNCPPLHTSIMSRRKESKMERIRAEEDELDRRLQEAGMYEDGMDVEMKKIMLQTLEESRKSAQEEEHQRKQWEKQEVQIYKDTLNKSFNKNTEKNCHAEVGCNEEHGNEENSGDSDVVALPPEDGADTNCLSGSGYVTPDLDLLRSGSPELLVSSESPSPSCSLTSSAPIATRPNSQPSVSTVGGSQAQPHGSEEDLFCDLQTLETSSVPKTPKRNSQQICKMNESNSQGNEMKLCTMSATNQEAVEVEEQEANNITSSITKGRKALQNNCQIEPRRSLRSSSIEIVPSQSAKSDKGLDQINRLSQPLPCNTRNSWQEGYEEDDGVQLLSPIIGQKKILEGLASSNSTREKIQNLQDAKVSNTLEVQSIQHTIEATIDDDDDDDFILPTPGASLSTEANRLQSSFPVDSRHGESRNKLQKPEMSAKGISTEDENIMIQSTSQDVNSSPMNSSSKLCDKVKEHTSCANMDLSDNEENLSYNFKSDRKRKVNVFFIEDNPDVPLKRRRLEEEEPSKAYFRSRKEPAKDCVLRILNMINAMMKSVGEYQSKHIRDKMKWSFPLTVDRRLKDSLERSKIQTRKHGLDLDACSENVIQHRTLRNAHKATDSYEVESQISEDSLPDICMNDGNWIDVQGKKERRKRGLHLGLGRKQSKHSGLLSRKDKLFNSSQDYEKSFVYESDEAEDFEIFPSSSQRKHSSRGRIEIDKSSVPKDTSTECTEVLSSKMHHSEVEKNIEAVGTTEDIEVESHLSGDEDLLDVNSKVTPNNKRRKVESLEQSDTFAVNKQCSAVENKRKRPMRRTFILSDDKSFDIAEPSTSSAQNVETSKITNLASDVQLTTEQLACQRMSPLSKSVAKDSGNCLKSSNKKDYCGKKVDIQNCVSSSGGKDDQLNVGRSSNVEICIVEDNPSVGTSGFNLTRGANKESRRGKPVQDQIRPAPLRLKKNCLKNTGEIEVSKNQFAVSSGAQQIASGVGATSQVHASDCSEIPESPQKQPKEVSRRVNRKQNQRGHLVEEVEVEHITENTKSSGSTKLENTRTPTGHERCLICKKTFKEGGDYLIHVNACKRMEDIKDSIVSPMASRTPGNKSGNPEGSARTPDRGIGRPRPNVRTGSLFEHLEGNLEFINGDITDPAYRSPNIALVQILNCVAVKPHGLSQILAEIYPYCGSYTRRRAIGTLNRAVLEDRPQPGNIEICHPDTVTKGPAVVNVFGQFYMGKEKNRNLYTKRLIQQLQSCMDVGPKRAYKGKDPRYLEPFDHQLLSGLLDDTSKNRIYWFCEGLNKLAVQVPNGKFSLIIFPSGIGCGLAGGNWERDYLPAIKMFSRQVYHFGIRVKIVRKIMPRASDSEIAIIGTMKRTVKPPK
ncbi:uncharacterized protein [Procambarus clarkii]|uniref:uncharacterized protein isoform X2 n=1 Tax=Procambarus clarkii TaxID=6728 RepID=UPI003743F6E1